MRIHYAQGKCLGGSSGRNQMYYHRGTPGAYRAWADGVGDDSYLWDNYFQFFQRSTRFTKPSVNAPLRAKNATPQYNMSSFGANDGPLQLSYPNHANPFSSYLPKAFEDALRLPAIDAFTSGNLNGHAYSTFTFNPFTGLRSSSETAFLSSAMRNASSQKRSNLQVYTLSKATQILFDSNNTATGAKINSMGALYTLSARKEVILSAGPWHSPQLLMLSGIGPRATLEELDIPVISDRPGVGQGMWDSTNVGGVSQRVAIPTTSELNTPKGMARNIELFNSNRTGFLATSGGDYIGWHKLPRDIVSTLSQAAQDHLNSFSADWPDIEYVINSEAGSISGSDSAEDAATVGILLIASASRGNMTISSSDINDPPVISPNWFLSPIDHEIAVAAVRQARKI